MVALSVVRASNALIGTALPPGLVAVFVGGTSGIGEVSVKAFAKYANRPRVYIVGRSQTAADRIVAECKSLSPLGEFHFIKADVSLIRKVDELCAELKAKEQALNLLFLSAGAPSLDRAQHLHLLAVLNYYARFRIISNLLPLLQHAPSLRRIVTVGGGGLEGQLDMDDLEALRVPPPDLRGHLTTLITLGLEALARNAPEVSIVHDYPGTVKTPLLNGMPKEALRNLEFVPLEECGERHVYLATSARYPPRSGQGVGLRLDGEPEVSVGSNGDVGSGLYSVGKDGEGLSPETLKFLAVLRGKGTVDTILQHTEAVYKRITETKA
ncbi:NAD(P)-binding domain protein [Niveomyces insectorum RCEF 264]|uniref:NAD(P)-binding domain protein n=1 Tax=Niveomyces insectorum RCEF 264 TaxID=1081102 RepID=A0A168AAL8_9HYPO|nr:NAD(P)-binding domain protein [Niveomyces insectorum RCEF 264]